MEAPFLINKSLESLSTKDNNSKKNTLLSKAAKLGLFITVIGFTSISAISNSKAAKNTPPIASGTAGIVLCNIDDMPIHVYDGGDQIQVGTVDMTVKTTSTPYLTETRIVVSNDEGNIRQNALVERGIEGHDYYAPTSYDFSGTLRASTVTYPQYYFVPLREDTTNSLSFYSQFENNANETMKITLSNSWMSGSTALASGNNVLSCLLNSSTPLQDPKAVEVGYVSLGDGNIRLPGTRF